MAWTGLWSDKVSSGVEEKKAIWVVDGSEDDGAVEFGSKRDSESE